MQNLECGFNPNCFEKAKAGWHFLFFGQIAQTFIKCTNVALAHNTCVNTLHLSCQKTVSAMSSGGFETTHYQNTPNDNRKHKR